MKCLVLYAPQDSFSKINDILQSSNVEGISYFDVMGRGPLKRDPSERIVQGYKTGEKYVPDFVQRTRIETIVSDSAVDNIIESIKKENIKGKIFIFDVQDSINL